MMNRRRLFQIIVGTAGSRLPAPEERPRSVVVHAIDSRAFMENSSMIADALLQELRKNHPVLGTLRAIV